MGFLYSCQALVFRFRYNSLVGDLRYLSDLKWNFFDVCLNLDGLPFIHASQKLRSQLAYLSAF